MAEMLEGSSLESTTIGIYRTAATVKGGRRFSFSALVAIGDRNGSVGLGYGKAPGVPAAIEKAQKDAKRNMTKVILQKSTLPHEVTGRYGSSTVRLIPASPGTGVIAGATVRAVLELAGVQDCLTKSFGSNNQKNLSRATLEGLVSLRSKRFVEKLRGMDLPTSHVDEILEYGSKFAPTSGAVASDETVKAKGPVNTVGQKNAKGGKGRRGSGGGGGGRGRRSDSPVKPTDSTAAVAEKPAPQAPTSEPQAPAPGGE